MCELADGYSSGCNKSDRLVYVTGAAQTLVHIFKTGHRNDLLPRVDLIFDSFLKTEVTNKFNMKSSLLKKSRVSLAQQIGCVYLKPRVAKWRY